MLFLRKRIPAPPTNITNNITNNNTINITINNYLKPSLKHLGENDVFKNLFREHLIQTPMKLIPIIWFNPDIPDNLSVYLVNKNTKETLVYDGVNWQISDADKISKELLII